MNFKHELPIVLVMASTLGCATSANHAVTVDLEATRQNAGQIANVTLSSQGTQTGLTFFIGGVPNGTTLPLRLYTFINKGSCQQPGPMAYALNDRVDTERMARVRTWRYSRTANITMSALYAHTHSIVVRTTPADGSIDIFCGNINQTAP
ncbi:hypothetical protein ACU5P1_10450 [Pseudomonas plecoglossicida]|uniref:Lipoprotein n=1 Tax=Pseudomonas plecoglossicida TaxID=70775 RepID=A0AAD0QRW0_PSEDL|nr:hypothetical protein [Pseudomonas plecoglossicida]AXM94478.1 hypothetical protein DVB73_00855 [Pseudomonas plecoglossicida]EPB93943.1 hypothetical protein L321_21562 [Pseudomonas plecoglossicida NB2011]QLB55211.1 hypothetical protein HAV28_10375 [Pseudomonas plecoglossicida]GLR35149.1 hypothetical protein GCM10011247_05460 [Pseudomonas plecoglossicida]